MSFIHDNDVSLMYQHVVALPQGFGKTRFAMANLAKALDEKMTYVVHSSAKHLAPEGAQVIVMDKLPLMPKITPRPSFGDVFLNLLAKEQKRPAITPVESRVSLFVKNQMGIVPNVPFSE